MKEFLNHSEPTVAASDEDGFPTAKEHEEQKNFSVFFVFLRGYSLIHCRHPCDVLNGARCVWGKD